MSDEKKTAGSTQESAATETGRLQPAAPAAARRRLIAGGLAGAPIFLSLASRSALANTCVSPSRVFSGNASPHQENFSCGGRSPGYWKQPQHFASWPLAKPDVETYKNGNWSNDDSGGPSLGKFTSWKQSTLSNGDARIGNGIDNSGSGGHQFGASFASVFGSVSGMKPVVPNRPAGDNKGVVDGSRAVCMWEILCYPSQVASEAGLNVVTVQLARHLVAAYFNTYVVADYPLTRAQIVAMWQNTGGLGTWCPIPGCSTGWGPAEIICYLKRTFDFIGFGPDDYPTPTCP